MVGESKRRVGGERWRPVGGQPRTGRPGERQQYVRAVRTLSAEGPEERAAGEPGVKAAVVAARTWHRGRPVAVALHSSVFSSIFACCLALLCRRLAFCSSPSALRSPPFPLRSFRDPSLSRLVNPHPPRAPSGLFIFVFFPGLRLPPADHTRCNDHARHRARHRRAFIIGHPADRAVPSRADPSRTIRSSPTSLS